MLLALTLLVGTFSLVFFSLPFEQAKNIANFFSRDGNLESFTPAAFGSVGLPVRVAGGLLLAVGLALLLMPVLTQRWIGWFVVFSDRQSARMRDDRKAFWAALRRNRPGKWALAALLVIMLVGAGIRWASIGRAMGHDEAYTYEAFASRSLDKVLTDYHLPNNHVLHTILVHLSTRLFGDTPWAVRFPAFLAGILLIPAAYLVGKRMFSTPAGLLAAALTAVAPVMISYSTNARGYTLLALLTLVSLILALYVRQHNNRFGWGLLSLTWALGFYTLPIMLYPFGMVWLWLLASTLVKDIGVEYVGWREMVKSLVVSALAAALLAVAFYSPIFISGGIGAFTNNTFVQSLSFSDFWQTFPHRIEDTLLEWNDGFPNLTTLLLAGTALSLLFHPKVNRHKVPVQLVAAAWISLALLIQRPNPWAKLWVFLFPLMATWACAGWLGLLKGIRFKVLRRFSLAQAAAVILAIVLLATSSVRTIQNLPETTAIKEVEKAAIFLAERIQPGDVIAMDYPWDVTFWYYARRHGIPRQYYLDFKDLTYNHVYVVVSGGSQTAQTVLKSRQKDGITCDPGTIHVVQKIDNTLIYDCEK